MFVDYMKFGIAGTQNKLGKGRGTRKMNLQNRQKSDREGYFIFP